MMNVTSFFGVSSRRSYRSSCIDQLQLISISGTGIDFNYCVEWLVLETDWDLFVFLRLHQNTAFCTLLLIMRARDFQKNIYFCFIDYAKVFDCVDHNKLWKFLKEMGIPDHLTYLLRNLYAGQEETVRNEHGTIDWLQIGKGVHQGCILSPCLFNLYAEYIMWNAGLDGAQAGINIARRKINNLRYADDTTLWQKAKKN